MMASETHRNTLVCKGLNFRHACVAYIMLDLVTQLMLLKVTRLNVVIVLDQTAIFS